MTSLSFKDKIHYLKYSMVSYSGYE